ncbi:flagellar assembly peptidoglycan hydrolase FlgJ [Entomohabitans teleogrylli]|uniref:flagellar assembly peptidoglycan hydrolase FlgJ n=1 Tax=Entomohabitans teleogrylli TaxID=1384589 RepID=UPI00073D34A5|nr:flagellar assembly peptidoglycan hydrolase FlgJ [Entomohabitans teleogrylli]
MTRMTPGKAAAFDVRALDALRRTARETPREGIRAVAEQMEGLFVQMMLKSMREASVKGGLFNSQQTGMFTAMYDQQISQDIAAQGRLGFAELITRQMGGEEAAAPDSARALTEGGLAQRVASRYAPVVREAAQESGARRVVSARAGSKGFIARMMGPAIAAAKKSGVPHQLIIAQAALESGWGNREILTRDGRPSHNLFGIKATPGWKGATTEITTTEYIDGRAQKVKAAFRVYGSYSEALADYAALIAGNPRYQRVKESTTPEAAAHALQSGGYATDPHYAKKLISVMQQIKGNVNQALNAYKNDLSSLF